jgi:hypothetical protein
MGLKVKKFKKAAKKAGKSFKKGAKKVGKAVKSAGTIGKNDLRVNKGDLRKGVKSAGKYGKKVIDAHVDGAAALFTGGGSLVAEQKSRMDDKEDEANQRIQDELEADARNTREQAAKRKRIDEEEENNTRGTKTGGTGRVSLRI